MLEYARNILKGELIMNDFTKDELEKALAPIVSLISKCEKVLPKLKVDTPQYSLTKNRINALKVAEKLMIDALAEKE